MKWSKCFGNKGQLYQKEVNSGFITLTQQAMYWFSKIITLCLFALIISCTHQTTNIETIRSDAKNKIALSHLFSNIRIIPLETNPSGLVGLSVRKIEYYQNKIFILNQLQSHRNILCFDNTGKFLFTIDKIGRGPGEYGYLGDFTINRKEGQIILCLDERKYFHFNLEGQFLFERQTNDTYFGRQICSINDSIILVFNDQSNPPVGYDLLCIDAATMNIKQKSASISVLSGILQSQLPISVFKEHIMFYDATDTIYDITNNIGKRQKKYYVDFGSSHHRSKLFMLDNYHRLSYTEMLEQFRLLFSQKKIVLVSSLVENEEYILIGYYENQASSKDINLKNSFLLYDKNSRKTYNSDNITFDVLNLSDMNGLKILGNFGDSFHALFEPEWSQQIKEKITQSEFISEKMKDEIRSRDITDNPLLVILE